MTAVSLQYVLANPVVASCVTGASSIEQLKENVAAVQSQPLTSEELQFIKDLTKSDGYTQHRIHP